MVRIRYRYSFIALSFHVWLARLVYTTYAAEGLGAAKPPPNLPFLLVFAGEAGKYEQKRRFLEDLQSSKPPENADCASRVIYSLMKAHLRA
jgi:hypothetical protein